MPVNQERLESVKIPPYVYTDTGHSDKFTIKISDGDFKDVVFTVKEIRIVEADGEATLQFSYDVEHGVEMINEYNLVSEFDELICAIMNEILMNSVNYLRGIEPESTI